MAARATDNALICTSEAKADTHAYGEFRWAFKTKLVDLGPAPVDPALHSQWGDIAGQEVTIARVDFYPPGDYEYDDGMCAEVIHGPARPHHNRFVFVHNLWPENFLRYPIEDGFVPILLDHTHS